MPWKGKRILLVGFTPNGAWEDAARAKVLLDLGFVPPSGFHLPKAVQETPSNLPVPHPGTPDGGPIRSAIDPPVPKPSRVPYLLELFCGSAGVSSAFIRLGGEALGIDRCLLPRSIKAPCVRLDLTRASDQALILDEVRRADIIWLAPPCGTCSRAREIPLRASSGASGKLKAEPLRSAACPEGFPNLSGVAGRRVRLANQLYMFTAQVVELCVRQDKVCVIENPSRSWFWSTRWIKPWVARLHSLHSHACMYGADLKKATRLLSTHQLPSMQATCDGAHAHKSWGLTKSRGQWGFRTTGTAEYPSAFCKAAASDFMEICASRNAFPAQEVVSEAFGVAAAAGRQPRGQSFQVGPSEFGSTCTMRVPVSVSVSEVIDGQTPWPLQGLPLGSRLLNSRTVTGEGGEEGVREVKFGIFRTPDSFLREALKMRHPFDEPSTSDMGNIRAMQVVLERGVEGTKTLRQKTLDYYRRRELELRSDEEALKATMDHRLAAAVWTVPKEAQACRLGRIAAEASCKKASPDLDVARAVWAETLEQVEKSWMKGPFSWAEIEKKYNGCWIPSKRFGVAQSDKVRSVDDLSEFLINSAVTETEKITLEGIDHIVSLARFFLGATTAGVTTFRLPASEGQWVTGRLHSDWRGGRARLLRGRALDLKAAYKQLARHPKDGWVSIVAVLNPDSGEVSYFEAVALPFGAVSAVTGFNRAARALRRILSILFSLVTTNFYDDFCQLELEPLQESAREIAEEVLGLLGWKIAQGAKALPFDRVFNMLGATISFERAAKGDVLVKNKPGRLEAIEEVVMRRVSERRCDRKRMLSIKGKLLFAAGHVFGRCAQLATQLISHRGNDRHQGREHMDDLLNALQFALETLKSGGPRCVGAWSQQPPVLIFTDGACEQEGNLVTHGALLFDPVTGRKEVFGDHVPKCLVERWKGGGKKQVIFFAEIFPAVVAKATWKDVVQGRRVLFFLDNEGARFTFIRSYSAQVNATDLLMISA
ncbi:unnamed protein product, partial [Symbiodinium necroappetens]